MCERHVAIIIIADENEKFHFDCWSSRAQHAKQTNRLLQLVTYLFIQSLLASEKHNVKLPKCQKLSSKH